jgi:hypothetical protein
MNFHCHVDMNDFCYCIIIFLRIFLVAGYMYRARSKKLRSSLTSSISLLTKPSHIECIMLYYVRNFQNLSVIIMAHEIVEEAEKSPVHTEKNPRKTIG